MTTPLKAPSVAAVIVDYFTREYTLDLLKDLSDQTLAQVVVVDNSGDEQYGQGWHKLPGGVRLVRSPRNMGFGAGVNLGASVLGDVDHLLVMNSDLRVSHGDFQELAASCERLGLGAMGPLLVDQGGHAQADAGGEFPRTSRSGVTEGKWITGACFITPLELFRRVGGFDERYFMYWEDVDYCRKLYDLGLRVGRSDSVVVVHVSGGSEGRESHRYARARVGRDLFLEKWGFDTRERLFRRAQSWIKLFFLRSSRR